MTNYNKTKWKYFTKWLLKSSVEYENDLNLLINKKHIQKQVISEYFIFTVQVLHSQSDESVGLSVYDSILRSLLFLLIVV